MPNLTRISLKHDLKYAYGEPGDSKRRVLADLDFYSDLVIDGCCPEMAHVIFSAIRVFGEDDPLFGWGFARK